MRKRKEYLIPLEKKKKTIHLESRGRKKMPFGSVLCGALGLICLIYCLAIALFVNYGTKFFFIWGALGVFLCAFSVILAHKHWLEKLPRWLKSGLAVCFIAAILLFCFIEILILSQFHRQASPGADYVIVLGAQWKESGPSYVLQQRLDKAIAYLEENPAAKVIVSGGKGANEPVSEGEGMQGYLIEAGIASERILVENQSVNTYENIKRSGEFLDKSQDSVVIVTNNFHVFRAVSIARKQGYANVQGLPAPCYPGTLPNNMLREFFGVIKDFAVGNL